MTSGAEAMAELPRLPDPSSRAAGPPLPRLLLGARADGPALTLREHLGVHGPRPHLRPGRQGGELVTIVSESGLRGRGGGAFPTAAKLSAVARSGRRTMVVANGAEGEPASAKDRFLLGAAPHLVLDGAVLAAEAVGAREAIICIHGGPNPAIRAVTAAIDERREEGGDRVRLKLVEIPPRYVAGEESALVHLLNGGPATPTLVPPRPFQRGVGGRPTLVQNVETLAHIALIARHGPDWFRSIGAPEAPGSALVTVTGELPRPGVFEIELGVPIPDLLRHAGGEIGDFTALLVGGYFGTWVSAAEAATQRLDQPSLSAAGHAMGAGVIVAIRNGRCGLAETAHVMRYLARESAGQCGPCVHGLAAIADEMTGLAAGNRRADPERLVRWSEQVQGRGACRHPDGAVRLLASALRVFGDDVNHHVHHGPCAAASEAAVLPVTPPIESARSAP
jgi:NADH:ubiquinone oxidoreductase subunit F (NADH-binding)